METEVSEREIEVLGIIAMGDGEKVAENAPGFGSFFFGDLVEDGRAAFLTEGRCGMTDQEREGDFNEIVTRTQRRRRTEEGVEALEGHDDIEVFLKCVQTEQDTLQVGQGKRVGFILGC